MSQRASRPPPSEASGSSGSRAANGKRSAKAASQTSEGTMPDRKKSRTEKRPKSFKPRPIGDRDRSEGSEDPIDLPPPPSTRKIARLRDSFAVERAMTEQSPAPARNARPMFGSDSEDDPASTRAESVFTSKTSKPVPHLSFKPFKRPRPSAAPPPSPGMVDQVGVKRRARKSCLGENVFDSVEPLPITDTPVINKNRQLRKDAERRSSLGMRGQRASSSFGRGDPTYPHSGVPSSSFYKHLPIDKPEPLRTRWLISWCAKRALDEHLAASKKKQRAEAPDEIDKLLSEVMDAFATSVAKGGVDTNVFGEPGAPTSSISVRPHPRNVENRATLEKENAIIRRMRDEDRDWNRLAAKTNDLQAMTMADIDPRREVHPPDMTEASSFFQQAMRLADSCAMATSKVAGSERDFQEVEFEVDMLNQAAHQAHQYVSQSGRFLDGIFSSLAADLRARGSHSDTLPPPDDSEGPDATALLSAAAGGPSRATSDPMHMLRSLAAADSTQRSAEAVAKAAAVPAAPAASRAPAMTPRRTGTFATPRRASVYGKGTPGRR